jgi:hypothetical protein
MIFPGFMEQISINNSAYKAYINTSEGEKKKKTLLEVVCSEPLTQPVET